MRLSRRVHSPHAVSQPHRRHSHRTPAHTSLRCCRFEQLESRELLSVSAEALAVGVTYLEDSNKTDQTSVLSDSSTEVADILQVSYTGGADGTELTTLTITLCSAFFDTSSAAPGAYGSFPLTFLSHEGFDITSSEISADGTTLTLTFDGFDAGEMLVFTVDVDETGNLSPNAVVEGAEFEGATFTADFTAAHYTSVTVSGTFYDSFAFANSDLAAALPNDSYDNTPAQAYVPSGAETGIVYTAGAEGSAQQEALATLSGTVYYDLDADNVQDSSEKGIQGVTLSLYQLVDGEYVSTGVTTTTDADGNYTFTDLEPGTYQVRESQPSDYISVGSSTDDGVVTSSDIISSVALEYGDDSVNNDFAETKYASLSGYVYYDADNDGAMDAGESGIAGAQVTVTNVATGGTYVTTTASDGSWSVTGLMPGTYKVTEVTPDGYLDGTDAVGSAGGTLGNDLITNVILVGGQSGTDYDFGELLPASLSGHVYYDADNNGMMAAGESGIAGATVVVVNISTGATYTTTTDENGAWAVTGLAPGTYKVTETTPDGYLDGLDALGTAGGTLSNDLVEDIVLVSGQSGTDYDFGELLPSCIGGYVYVDADNDGVYDAGETPIAGVTVYLLDADGEVMASMTTDENGFYRFCELAPGVYSVAEAQPAGYYDGLDTAGTLGGIAHNPGDLIEEIVLTSGVKAQDYNFGELLPASVSGTVFVDLDNDGVIDSGEKRLSGVTVYLLDADGNRIATTTTDASGNYRFTDREPGVYGVEEVQPDDYFDNADYAGSVGGVVTDDMITTIVLASGVAATSYNFTETMPATISGYVFQDGSTIYVEEGETVDVTAVRDGQFTSDDTPLAGVTLILCDGSGVPLTDADGNYITTITDANGYYEFTGLEAGVYSIQQVQPSGYTTGIDTAGSNGGVVVNTYTYSTLSTSLLSSLALTSSDNAIVRITVSAGDNATQYNFSEVVIQTETTPPPGPNPPTYPSPLSDPVTQLPGIDYSYIAYEYTLAPQMIAQPLFGAGGPGGYTWHLSVIDGGSPRGDASANDYAVQSDTNYFDPATWTGVTLDEGEWTLVDQDGNPLKTIRFGLPGATPVAGDWNGDGTTKIAVFIDGLWFFDLNGDGRWDENDLWAKLGHNTDQPVAGDWDGDGKTDIAIFGPAWIGDARAVATDPGLPDAQNMLKGRQKNVPPDPMDAAVGYRTLKRGKTSVMRSDLIDHVFQYGADGDIAVIGDWNGDGVHTIGVFRKGTWFLDVDGDGRWGDKDSVVKYGQEGDIPVVGDWNGDGVSKLGIYRNGAFHLDVDNNQQFDAHDKVFALGGPGDKPVVGDWTGDGVDKVGVYHNSAAAATDLAPIPATNTVAQ